MPVFYSSGGCLMRSGNRVHQPVVAKFAQILGGVRWLFDFDFDRTDSRCRPMCAQMVSLQALGSSPGGPCPPRNHGHDRHLWIVCLLGPVVNDTMRTRVSAKRWRETRRCPHT